MGLRMIRLQNQSALQELNHIDSLLRAFVLLEHGSGLLAQFVGASCVPFLLLCFCQDAQDDLNGNDTE